MMGKVLAAAIVLSGLIAGVAVYYFQVYAYYDEIAPGSPDAAVRLTLADGTVEQVAVTDFRGIDSDSSPIRYRACFRLTVTPDAATHQPYPGAEPLVAPRWFDCFNAREIGEALAAGQATAWMGAENQRYGIDRIVAVMADGRAFAWHQINACGREVFDGNAAPAGCPPPPVR
ncbi:MAG: DUF6446 family protein [Pseudorhodobacter sp.]